MGKLNDVDCLELFSELIRSGMAWNLQGHYGRTATSYINEGYIDGDGDRSAGITLALNNEGKKFISPSLTEGGWYCAGASPLDCNAQGYFYDEQ